MGGYSEKCSHCDRWFIDRTARRDHIRAKHSWHSDEWQALVSGMNIKQCSIVHDLIIQAIDPQIYRKDHPTPRYQELLKMELVLIDKVNALGGYPQ